MDIERKVNVLLLCIVGVFPELLMAHLMYLDQTPGALWDIVFENHRNPVTRCIARLSHVLSSWIVDRGS